MSGIFRFMQFQSRPQLCPQPCPYPQAIPAVGSAGLGRRPVPGQCLRRWLARLGWAWSAGVLFGCSTPPPVDHGPAPTPGALQVPMAGVPGHGGGPASSGRAQWQAASWSELPGFDQDNLAQAWSAWINSCARPRAPWQALCDEVKQLVLKDDASKRLWMQQRLRVFRIENQAGQSSGLLTAYYEPLLRASRLPSSTYAYPVYAPPIGLRQPWHTRQAIETSSEAQLALSGRAWAWLTSPVDVMNLQVQGSGKLVLEEEGNKIIRAAFAGHNGQPFRSPIRPLLERGQLRSATWQGLQDWVDQRLRVGDKIAVQQAMQVNPRYIFFQEEALGAHAIHAGPKGAEGVALTAGRSIAVDPRSIPYSTPVWLVSSGMGGDMSGGGLQRMVLAQDTGSAITGAVRADFYAGTGPQAGDFASRINQPLRLWVLWPKDSPQP